MGRSAPANFPNSRYQENWCGSKIMELRRIDLNLLVILDALLDHGSITRVAETLELSQPTVSAALGKLRTVLNDELFVRSQSGMQPTERAMQLREPIQRILRTVRLEVLALARFDPAELNDTITISTSDVGELEFLPGLIDRMSARAPKASIRTVIRHPQALADAMDEGEIDLAIGYFPDLQTAVFKQQVLFSHDIVCIVRRDHPLYANGLDLNQYRDARHLVVSQESRSQDVIDQALRELGVVRHVALTISHYVNVPPLISGSDLIATIARPIAYNAGKTYPIALIDAPFAVAPMQIKQIWHRRYHRSPKLIWLRNLIADMSQNKPHL
jgi:DNA-binding transcriptional LysR family regulator